MARKMSIDTQLANASHKVSNVTNLRTRYKSELLILDLFCGAGGASAGYMRAGFKVVGIDICPQPRYIGDEFIQMNALECDYEFLSLFDMIHASPPCQAYSKASAVARKKGKVYPDLIHPVRRMLIASGKPYVMENVTPAPLRPDICLDGTMFDLGVIRKRLFESNIPDMPKFPRPSAIEGSVLEGDYVSVTARGGGNGNRKKDWEKAMGIDWMSKYELKESIPPAFTEWIGTEALKRLVPGLLLKQMAASNPRKLAVPRLYPIQARMEGF